LALGGLPRQQMTGFVHEGSLAVVDGAARLFREATRTVVARPYDVEVDSTREAL
jgi:hypothetical protein